MMTTMTTMAGSNFWHEFFSFMKSGAGKLIIVLIFVAIMGFQFDEIIKIVETVMERLGR